MKNKIISILIIILLCKIAVGYTIPDYIYDAIDNLIKIDYPGENNDIYYSYDSMGNLISEREMINGLAYVTIYKYDEDNNLVHFKSPEEEWAYEYDNNGNVIKENVNGQITTYDYDENGRVTCVNCGDDSTGIPETYDYDENGNVIGYSMGSLTINQEFDEQGRLAKISSEGTEAVYNYDEYGALTSIIGDYFGEETNFDDCGYDDGFERNDNCDVISDGVYTYNYDEDGNMITQTSIETGETVTYQYCDNGLKKIIYSDGSYDEYIYNEAGYAVRLIDSFGNVWFYLKPGDDSSLVSEERFYSTLGDGNEDKIIDFGDYFLAIEDGKPLDGLVGILYSWLALDRGSIGEPICGDDVCGIGESSNNCPEDCGDIKCSDKCGDGYCDEIVCMDPGCACAEDADNCPEDCATTNCEDYRYNNCPEGCVKRCVSSSCCMPPECDVPRCTGDCNGPGSCTSPDEICGDGVCSPEETIDNCPQDCKTEECAGEGELIPVYPGAPECCEGLTRISISDPLPDGKCVTADGGVFCSDCGNGACEEWENECNCPKDCGEEETKTECEEKNGICTDFQESCAAGYESSAFACTTRSEKCCIEKETECTDSDGGENIYVKGIASDPVGRDFADYCQDGNTLIESICAYGNAQYTTYTCPTSCQEGVCTWEGERLIDNGDETITDSQIGSMWQKEKGAERWEQAIFYCNNLNLGGYSDWRLPSIDELDTISGVGNLEPFSPSTGWYWTSTVGSGGLAWAKNLNLETGEGRYEVNQAGVFAVRCVRG